jgi:hypothetical protein
VSNTGKACFEKSGGGGEHGTLTVFTSGRYPDKPTSPSVTFEAGDTKKKGRAIVRRIVYQR